MEERVWTTEQRQCFESRGGTLLVSAAAGSGKTAVLVERILHRVLGLEDGLPIDIDRLLIVTFTRAAADEMKQRLSQELTKIAAADPTSPARRQLLRLPFAQIGTIDSFCAWLIREYADPLDISPDFKVMDADPAALLWQAALTEVLEQRYAANDPAFIRLADSVSDGKDDKPLLTIADELHTFLQSLPFPEEWQARQLSELGTDLPAEQTVWVRSRRDRAIALCREAKKYLDQMAKLITRDPLMFAKYHDITAQEGDAVDTCLTLMQDPDLPWAGLTEAIGSIAFGRLPSRKKTDPPSPLFDSFQRLRKKAKTRVADALGAVTIDFDRFDVDRRETAALLTTLFEFVAAAEAVYAEKKSHAHAVDFGDVERLALRLLITRENGVSTPTDIAVGLHEQFEEIFVDEYQDVNELQNALFSALSREEQNLFLVGDVKQSIYGFRKARPELFLDRLHRFTPYDGETYPATILLKENFRSRPQVTDAVNFICSQLFSPEVGGLIYGADEALLPHREPSASDRRDTTLLVIDGEKVLGGDDADPSDGESRTMDETEATVIAQEIRALVDSGMEIPLKDGTGRPIEYGDCCILLRSFHEHAAAYEACLNRLGIPAHAAGTGDFFAASEIRLMMSLLECIDNPLRDVPMLAVLMSPIYGFTPDDLAQIRLQDRRRHLYVALKKIALTDSPLATRCAAFLREIDAYRLLSATVPVDRLIRQIYETTDVLHLMAVRTDGAQRVANLHLFYDGAHSFEENGFRGLSAFLRHLQRLKANATTQTAAVGDPHAAVQIMSIHHAKGLEYPVVFAAGLSVGFNAKNISGTLLMHADAGIALKIIDPETLVKRETVMCPYVRDRLLQDERSEALRVLYVAMTRAREKLYLLTTLKKPQETMEAVAADVDQAEPWLAPSILLNGRSFGDWVLHAAFRHPDAAPLREIAGAAENFPLLSAATPWKVRVIDAVAATQTADAAPSAEPQPDPELLEELTARFAYEYPYKTLGQVPSKVAASGLTHRDMSRSFVATARPAILNQSELTAAERGTALHTFLQYADWAAAAASPEAERDRLVAERVLTRQQAAAVEIRRLRAFFGSELYQRIARADHLWREIPFTIEAALTQFGLSAEEIAALPADAQGETMLIQGIADCVFEEDGGLVIVDYKTDRVASGDELIDRYHRQLELYALALRQTLDRPVRECLLYSFALGKAFPVPINSED